MRFEYPQKKFEIKKENIIALHELPKKIPPELRKMGWPLELQGSGRTLEDGRNLQVRYPAGDVFYSWNVIIHELGHLRQDEFSEEIRNEKDDVRQNLLKEKDAKVRGWARVEKYAPELMEIINEQFAAYKAAGKIPDFNSFEELYNDFNANNLKINEVMGLESDPQLAAEKLKINNISEFINKIEKNKVGQKINTEIADDAILNITSEIINE